MKNYKLDLRFSFEQFVCGRCNRFAFSKAQAVAAAPGTAINPLFFYGAHGLGKSHLLHAVGNQVLACNPKTRTICCSVEDFEYEMVHSVIRNRMDSFRSFFNSADLLLIDDLEFIFAHERMRQELTNICDKLIAQKAQIVFAANVSFPVK